LITPWVEVVLLAAEGDSVDAAVMVAVAA